MIKTILFPTEFSDHAPNVFLYALEVAQQFNAKVVAFHATRKLNTKILFKEDKQKLATEKLIQLKEFTKKYQQEKYKDVAIEHLVANSLPSDGILEIVKEKDVQLIVMGMTGKSSILGNLFGSVAKAVLKESTCSVLVIPAAIKFELFINMVVKVDFTFHHIKSLFKLQQFAAAFMGKIYCFHEVKESTKIDLSKENMAVLENIFSHQEFSSFTTRLRKLDSYIDQVSAEFTVSLVVFLAKQVYGINYSQEGEEMGTAIQKIKQPLLMLI